MTVVLGPVEIEMPRPFEEYLRTALASLGDAVISTDLEGRVVFANRAALSVLRATEQEIAGKHFDEVFRIHNEYTNNAVENPLRKVLAEGAVVGLANHTILTAFDGTKIPIDDSAAPLRAPDGTLEGAVIVFRDITERRRSEEAARLLAAIVESSDDAIISKNLNGIVTSWNKGAERIFGYSAAEIIGRPISVIASPDRVDEMPKILARIRQGERIEHYETVRRAKNGSLVNISLTVSPVRDPEGRIVGASKIARDITGQVRVRAQLAEQQQRLRVTLHSIGDAVIATDRNARVDYLNPVAEALTGWTTAEAAGKALHEIFHIVNEETRLAAEDPATKVLAHGHVVGLANHTVLISRDGREIAIDDSGAPIRDEHGQIIGVVLVFRDIGERRIAERQLAQQASDLRQINDELSQFAYAVSHDLREPLRNIANFSELLLQEYGPADGESQVFANYIAEGVGRMESLLNDLLAYSQLGAAEKRLGRVDINGLVREVLADLHSAIEETGADIVVDPLPVVVGHSAQLSQLFQNLLSNAIKYRSADPPQIRIRADEDSSHWTFRVADNGIGIASRYHKTVFGVFKRLHGKGVPGTGIGLAICAKVVDRHGGRIWVESEQGRGSEFIFTIPKNSGNGPAASGAGSDA